MDDEQSLRTTMHIMRISFFSLLPALVLSVFMASSACAQMSRDHAVLYTEAEQLDDDLVDEIAALGGRVAVRYSSLLLIRLPSGAGESIVESRSGTWLLRSREDCDLLGKNLTPHISRVLQYLVSVEDRDVGAKVHAEMRTAANFPCQDGTGVDCLGAEQEERAEALRALLKYPAGASATDPAVTSDVMVGSSTVAVFCIRNTQAQQQGAPDWTEELRSAAIASILTNLAWWSDMAASYGKVKTFTVREYAPDDTVCAVDFDPTEGYDNENAWVLDRRFQQPIMNALGYSSANTTLNMRAFCHDLRTAEATDWAYAAFLLVGKNTVRGHAFIGGPATVITASQLGTGLLFAHETGHVYHALDEYFEHNASNRRAKQSRFGVPNGNHHFRNYPVQPSLMEHGYPALSGYAAVHLGLLDTVRYTRVSTVPPDATYEVAYVDADDRVVDAARCQGVLRFAWGNGTRVRLRGLPAVEHDGWRHVQPAWDKSGIAELSVDVDSTVPLELVLRYQRTNTKEPFALTHLTTADALASEIVTDILPLDEHGAAFAGPKGIALWRDSGRVILDHAFGEGEEEYRQSTSIARGGDETLYFSSHGGEILGWKEGSVFVLSGPEPDLTYRSITVAEDGAVWATDAAVLSGRILPATVLHRFHDGQLDAFTPGMPPLPSRSITSIAPADGRRIWIAYGGEDARDQGLFEFDPESGALADRSDRLPSPRVIRLRPVGQDSLLVIMKGTDSARIERFVTLLHGTSATHWGAEHFRTSGALFDAAIDGQGRLVIATTLGIAVLDGDSQWMRFRTAGSELVSNICYSVTIASDGAILAGTNNGAMHIASNSTATELRTAAVPPQTVEIRGIYPNPMRAGGSVSVHFPRRMSADIVVTDILGRVVVRIAQGSFDAGRHEIGLPTIPGAGVYIVSCATTEGNSSAVLQVLR